MIVAGPLAAAEALWYETARWPSFVDGFAAVARRDPEWPRAGTLVWDSHPGGRGRVVERVVRWSPRDGQVAEVEDPRLRGTQEVAFRAGGDEVEVALALDYALKDTAPWMRVTNVLFVQRALRDSLRRTLARYARERRGDVELGLGS